MSGIFANPVFKTPGIHIKLYTICKNYLPVKKLMLFREKNNYKEKESEKNYTFASLSPALCLKTFVTKWLKKFCF